jgi:hypothetical protein
LGVHGDGRTEDERGSGSNTVHEPEAVSWVAFSLMESSWLLSARVVFNLWDVVHRTVRQAFAVIP